MLPLKASWYRRGDSAGRYYCGIRECGIRECGIRECGIRGQTAVSATPSTIE